MKRFVASTLAGALAFSVALPAFAEDTGTSSSSSSSSSLSSSAMTSSEGRMMKKDAMMMKKEELKKNTTKGTLDAACMQTAVEKRDNAIMAGVDAYALSVKTALTTRRDALKAAWALTDATQRSAANKAAWTAFQGTWKKASQSVKASRKAAWAAFKTDAKACGQTGAEASGESTDNQI